MKFHNWDIRNHDFSTWSLFIDRDGVINRRLVDDYVKDWFEFEFLPGVLEAIPIFRRMFQNIFIVTNQQGIGKGLMSSDDLEIIHSKMNQILNDEDGRIDGIYYCPHLKSEACDCRKPEIGMALKAKSQFPQVDFSKSIMLGDSKSDMLFGRNAGMKTIFVGPDWNQMPDDLLDGQVADLIQFAQVLIP